MAGHIFFMTVVNNESGLWKYNMFGYINKLGNRDCIPHIFSMIVTNSEIGNFYMIIAYLIYVNN